MTDAANMSNHSIIRPKDIRPAPAEIDYKDFKFLITDRPSDQTIQYYVTVCTGERRKNMVSICSAFFSFVFAFPGIEKT